MAGRKPAAKTTAKVEATEPKTASIKAEEKVAEPKATEVKKESAKKTTAKEDDVKTTAEKTTTKKTTEVKSSGKECVIHVQFAGKSISQDDLMKMAKDVWKYDLKKKVGELESVELYVKPEESMVYYVMNGEITGKFPL